MIKINLLNPYKESASAGGGAAGFTTDDDEQRKIYLDFARRALIMIIGPIGFYIYEWQAIPVLEAQLAKSNQEYNEIKQFNDSKQGLAEEIKKYEIEQARFNAQMDFINKIDGSKINEYRLFEYLKTSVPENIWITKLELHDNSLLISAEGDDVKMVEKFIQNLSKAEFITNLIPLNQFHKKNFAGTDTATTIFKVRAQLFSGIFSSPTSGDSR